MNVPGREVGEIEKASIFCLKSQWGLLDLEIIITFLLSKTRKSGQWNRERYVPAKVKHGHMRC